MRGFDVSEYDYFCSHEVQPTSSGQGAAFTPGNNTMGSWADVYTTDLTADIHAIEIVIHAINDTNGFLCDTLAHLGWDPAGGTNYGASALTKIPYLYCGYAASQGATGTGMHFFFPVLIPSGSTFGIQAQQNNAAPSTTGVCYLKMYRARRPRDASFGTQVVSFGEDTANSRGTALTMGVSGAMGSWTSITSSLSDPVPWYWSTNGNRRNNGLSATTVRYDIGFGSGTDIVHRVSEIQCQGTSEQAGGATWGGYARPASGTGLFVRGSTVNASGGDHSLVVHGVI